MADEEVVLIKVEVDQTSSLRELKETQEAIEGISQAEQDLNEQLKAGKITQEQYNSQKSNLETQLKKEESTRKTLTKVIDTESNSLSGQKSKLQSLLDERDKLDVSTTQGAIKHKALTKEIDGLSGSLGDAKKTSASFAQGIDKYGGALDSFGLGAQGAIAQVRGLTTASLAFLATPIGAILGVIVAALGTLASYFKNTGDGADQFAKIMQQLGAVVNVLIDRVSNFGRGLFNILTGNFEEGFGQLKDSIKGVGDEILREVESAGDLADELDRLEDAEKDYNVQASKTRNEIQLLLVQAKDRTKSEGERAALLEKALAKEIALNKEITQIRRDQLAAAVKEVADRANAQQRQNETLDEFAARLVSNEKLSDELRDKVRDGIKALNEAEGEALTFQEKLTDKRNELLNKEAATKQKAADEERKLYQDLYESQTRKGQEEADKRIDAVKKEVEQEKKLRDASAKSFADTQKKLAKDVLTAQTNLSKDQKELIANYDLFFKEGQDKLIGYAKFGAEARKLIASDEFKAFESQLNGAFAVANQFNQGITANREAEAKRQIDIVTLQSKSELAILEGKYEDDLAALQKQRDQGIITEQQFNDVKKLIDADYAKSKSDVERQAAIEQDRIKKQAFEANKKTRIADAIMDTIQAGISAFKALVGIPVVGPGLAAIAAAAALKFGYDKVNQIRNEQFVGSGVTESAPIVPVPAPIATQALTQTVDAGLVTDTATATTDQRVAETTDQRPIVVSVQEINQVNDRINQKVDVAESV